MIVSPAACRYRADVWLAAIPGLEHDSFIDDASVVIQPPGQAHAELNVVQALHVAQQVEEGRQLCERLLCCRLLGKRVG